MMQFIRNHMTGKFAIVIFSAIALSLGSFGVTSFFNTTATTQSVASVNGVEISSLEYDSLYQRQIAQFGDQDLPEFLTQTLRKNLLNSLIDRELMVQQAHTLNLQGGDESVKKALLQDETFIKDGKFDKATYDEVLRNSGMSPAIYEYSLRQQTAVNQLGQTINSFSAVVGEESLKRMALIDKEKRSMQLAVFPIENYLQKVAVSDEEIKTYFDNNTASLQQAERLKLSYIELSQAKLKAELPQPTEDVLMSWYNERKSSHYTQKEKREASHIFVALDEGKVDVALEGKFAQLASEAQGKSFTETVELAKKILGEKIETGLLGNFEKGGFGDKALDEAIFALPSDAAWTQPIRSSFGIHLVHLDKISPEVIQGFADVRANLAENWLDAQAREKYLELEGRLQELLETETTQLNQIAESLGVNLQETNWLTLANQEGLLANPQILNAVTADNVLTKGEISVPVALDDTHAMVFRVAEHEKARALTFEEAQPEIMTKLTRQSALKLAEQDADKLMQVDVNDSAVFTETAKSLAAEFLALDLVTRTETPNEASGLVQSAFNEAFTIPVSDNTKPVKTLLTTANTTGAGVIRISTVQPGELKDYSEAERSALEQQLQSELLNAELTAYRTYLKNKAHVEIQQSAIEATTTQ